MAGPRDQRVGLVHAVTNGVAAGVYAASWLARRRGGARPGVALALAGATVSGLGAYLGGHLTEARKVGSRHPAYAGGSAGLSGDPSLGLGVGVGGAVRRVHLRQVHHPGAPAAHHVRTPPNCPSPVIVRSASGRVRARNSAGSGRRAAGRAERT